MWQLRDNLSAYDASYVALAEALDAVLLTADRRLAKAVGTSRQTICAMEKGDYIPSLKLALLISKHFKKPVEDIFSLKKCPT